MLSGLSTGANCWFKYANSDSEKAEAEKAYFVKLECLGFVDVLCCQYYDIEEGRKESLKAILKGTYEVGIALENCSALEIIDNNYRIVVLSFTAKAYDVFGKMMNILKKKLCKSKSLWWSC